MIEVFSSGGGTQSTCIAALILQGRLPKPDFMVIADTGRERSTTWEYLDTVIRPAMTQAGIYVHRIGHEWSRNYADEFWGDTLQIPAFTNITGKSGKMKGFCSSAWKKNVITSYLSRNFGITRRKYRKWVGFSAEESRRVQRMMKGEEYAKGLIRFPLVHDVPMQRAEAIAEVKKMGWPTPPRSRCWMCPNQADEEWQEIKENDPLEFQKAVELEKKIQQKDPFAWLHGSCTPLDTVNFTAEPDNFDAGEYCSSGACYI